MKQFKLLAGFIVLVLTPLLAVASASAETMSVSVQITVTAVVPSHRDIILDQSGHIMSITSNTTEDVTPTVYALTVDPQHKLPLTDDLYAQYRTYVPVGTAKYGVLYSRGSATLSAAGARGVIKLISKKQSQNSVPQPILAAIYPSLSGS